MKALQQFKTFFPIADWLPNYKKANLSGDLSAGLTVGVMLIPQGMAYAMLAGLPPIHGLYAVTIPLILYAIFGTSRQLAVGPVAMVSLLAAAGIGALHPTSTEQYLLYAITLAFIVGVIQFGMGILKLGFVVNFLSHPVISGFTSAAAIIIGLSQVKHLFKIQLPSTEHAHEIFIALAQNIGDTHLLTLGLGIVSIIIIKYGKKIHPKFPAPLAAVVVGIALVSGFNLTESGVKVLGSVPSGLPGLSFPSFEGSAWSQLLPIAITISLVGFAESFAVAKAIQNKHKDYKLLPNQELIGLGMANFGAAFFQGYPVTGGFSRTAVNDQAGAKTALASIISVALIIITLLFLTSLFYNLPSAVLAAVVLVAVSGLIDFKEPKKLWKNDKSDFFMLIATFLATLFLGIETGIITGMVLSLIAVIYRASKPHMARLGKVEGTGIYRNIKRFNNAVEPDKQLIIRIDGPIYFANIEYIQNKIDAWVTEKGQLTGIVLDFEAIPHIDSSGAHALHDWIDNWHGRDIQVILCGMRGPVRDTLNKWNILTQIGQEHCFLSVAHALGEVVGEPKTLQAVAIQS
ncbi:MAG: solute carrier family 26 protein [Schleiferiaceae bacterium]|nr:solute carrier family 26 protein [Schleiferiaceae bacterium]